MFVLFALCKEYIILLQYCCPKYEGCAK